MTTVEENIEELQLQKAIRRLIKKLDKRLIPFLMLLEFSAFGSEMITGHTELTTLKADLNLSPEEESLGVTLLYAAYALFGIPSFILLRFLGTKIYLSLCMILWGAIMIGTAFVRNVKQLFVVRFLLGMVISAHFSGLTIYLSLWYRKAEQTMRISFFHAGAILGCSFGAIMSYGITKISSIVGLKDWQWIFMFEGLPITVLGIIIYIFLGNIPETVQWLNNCEKELLTNILREDAGKANGEPNSDSWISWRQVKYALTDRRIYLHMLIGIGNVTPILCFTLALPSLLHGINASAPLTHLMVAPMYVIACASCLVGSYSSSLHNEHGLHTATCLFISLIGFIILIFVGDQSKIAIYISSCIACCGMYTAFPIALSWLTKNVGGHTKRAMAICCVHAVDHLGGVLKFVVYPEVDKPIYRKGHSICAGVTAVALLSTFILRRSMMKENQRRQFLSVDEYRREVAVEEPCDKHPDFRYVL
ncbi:unnamed protein product [Rotaria socialis]|uniref:Major facilitator superfamily (MFS) profile domain-containing protein n=1 Tax=Rotaria socialis TaxID=392032 RepID=A0A817ZNM4_9BILA|nr:unnamed protein product [Rotaria socialis]CAF3391639.1 unnamed protein product [Rotaria socialis]CAF3615510.1 unnamed protein product [Rotaria socialis]